MPYAGKIASPEMAKMLACGEINASTGERFTTPGITFGTLRHLNNIMMHKDDPRSAVSFEVEVKRKRTSGKSSSWYEEDEEDEEVLELEDEMKDATTPPKAADSQHSQSDTDDAEKKDKDADKQVQGVGKWSQFRKKGQQTGSASGTTARQSQPSSANKASSSSSPPTSSAPFASGSRSNFWGKKKAGPVPPPKTANLKGMLSQLAERNQKLAEKSLDVGLFDASDFYGEEESTGMNSSTQSLSSSMFSQHSQASSVAPSSSVSAYSKFSNPFARSGGPTATTNFSSSQKSGGLLLGKALDSTPPANTANLSKLQAAQRKLLGVDGAAEVLMDEDLMIQKLIESGSFDDAVLVNHSSSEPNFDLLSANAPQSPALSPQAHVDESARTGDVGSDKKQPPLTLSSSRSLTKPPRPSPKSRTESFAKASKRKQSDRAAPKLGDFGPRAKIAASQGSATSPASSRGLSSLSSVPPAVIEIDESSFDSLPEVRLKASSPNHGGSDSSVMGDGSAASKKQMMAAAFIARMQGSAPADAPVPRSDGAEADESSGRVANLFV